MKVQLPEPIFSGKLLLRYKRFLADVALTSGEIITAHCPNSGNMTGLAEPGNEVLLSRSDNPKRKLRYTWELVKIGTIWVGVNTLNANRVVKEALQLRRISELAEFDAVKPEVVWGNSRFDFFLKKENACCYMEVKNVTLATGELALFPDAKTERGTKPLRELMKVAGSGMRAVILFLVHREDCTKFAPAADIDPVFAETLSAACKQGVEVLIYRTKIDPPLVALDVRLPFDGSKL